MVYDILDRKGNRHTPVGMEAHMRKNYIFISHSTEDDGFVKGPDEDLPDDPQPMLAQELKPPEEK